MEKIVIKNVKEADYKTYEAIKILRTNLVNAEMDGNAIAITSVMGKEGKTFVAFNTAMTIAASGKSCIYVNGNLRAADGCDVYEIETKSLGANTLAGYLLGKVAAENIVYQTEKDDLYIVEAGAPCKEAAEMLSGERYKQLIEKLRTDYDYVIIDTPAIGEVADGLVIGSRADGVVLVMETDVVPHEMAQKAKKQLEMNKCKLLGVVLNK
ncbi:MAG: CpsD/CapB family tyrosine-protein kinase [Lachnospiraceae bacterium]|nr:CpsD/CapB family tyrosine-protein kinase [Lachnospiraceae bacterium]